MNNPKYFFRISYNGFHYCGWQHQRNGQSVQEVVENTLGQYFKKDIKIVGCGRTDAGVHADNYYFHTFLPDCPDNLVFTLNKMLPEDIVVHEVYLVHQKAHAQKDATARTYTYYGHGVKNAFIHQYSTFVDLATIDFNKMEQAFPLIVNNSDFYQYCLNPEKHNATTCRINEISLDFHKEAASFAIKIQGDHFLKSMIRLLVGDLIEIGKGGLSLAQFEGQLNRSLLKNKHHRAYPQGLHLSDVKYPYIPTIKEE